jgi:hypothetical protein
MQRLTRKAIHQFKFKNDEPASQGSSFITDRANLAHALYWYHENGEVPKLRDAIEAYAEKKYPQAVSTIKSLKDNQISMTMCAIARMYMGGVVLPPDVVWYLDARLEELIGGQVWAETTKDTVKSPPENVVLADLEGFLDDFYRSNYKLPPHDFYKYLTETQANRSQVRSAVDYYADLQREIGTYDNLSKKQIKAYTEFVGAIIRDCETYIKNSRKETKLRKPRKKKLKSAEQLTAKVRFKESDPELRLTSVAPSQIIGAQSVWLFNVKTRRITYLETAEKLSVKGTTVIGFDPAKSFTKVIRKPETLADLLNTTKVRVLKDIQALKTKATPANGRISADVLILRANK